MTTATVIRWSPVDHAPELPLSAFNLIWSSSGSLILQGLYPTELNPPTKGIVLSFSNTNASMSFDEFSDYLNGMKVESCLGQTCPLRRLLALFGSSRLALVA